MSQLLHAVHACTGVCGARGARVHLNRGRRLSTVALDRVSYCMSIKLIHYGRCILGIEGINKLCLGTVCLTQAHTKNTIGHRDKVC